MRFSVSYFRRKIADPEIRQIARDSWSVSWPMAMIMFYEFFIGLTDVYVAGKFGKMALAAYGFSFQLYFIFYERPQDRVGHFSSFDSFQYGERRCRRKFSWKRR